MDEVLERGQKMAEVASAEGRVETERITDQMTELQEAWARLQDEMGKRRQRLNQSDLAQQYYNDADEAEAWIGEQELYMITEEKAKVRRSNTERRESGSESKCFHIFCCPLSNTVNFLDYFSFYFVLAVNY